MSIIGLNMQHFIVIGNPIHHSKSPEIHAAFARDLDLCIRYQKQLCPINQEGFYAVVSAFFAGGGTGANVTLPFKEMAYEICRQEGNLSQDAFVAKAVNTLAIKNGKLYGDNTDGRGLVADLLAHGICLQNKSVAILGAGGAARGAILPLIQAGAKISLFNRTLTKAQTLADDFHQFSSIQSHTLDALSHSHFDLVINATSATTTGQNLDLRNCQSAAAYDMMYGKPSAFLAHFAQQDSITLDGYGMLVRQAALSFHLWTNKMPSVDCLLA